MARSLVDFLEELDSNAELREAYLEDPVATSQSYGLTDEDVQIIKNQEWDTVRRQFETAGKSIKTHRY